MGDLLPDGVDYAVADYAVNSGPSRAAKALQGIVGAQRDGKIGPATLEAVSRHGSSALINQLSDQRLGFMRRIRGGKDWKRFGRGWTRRVEDVRRVGLSWAVAAKAVPQSPVKSAQPRRGLWARLWGRRHA